MSESMQTDFVHPNMFIKYLVPVGRTWLLLYLLLNPLQIGCDESLEALAVTSFSREGSTVTHQSVHPVLIDEL